MCWVHSKCALFGCTNGTVGAEPSDAERLAVFLQQPAAQGTVAWRWISRGLQEISDITGVIGEGSKAYVWFDCVFSN